MKKITAVVALAILIASCNPLSKMAKYADSVKYDVTPNPLEMHGDSIAVSMSGKFPPNYFHKLASIAATPSMRNASGEVVKSFEPIKLIGIDVEGDGQKIDFTKGGTFSYEDVLAYDPKMENVKLTLDVSAGYKTKSKDFGNVDLGDGTIITPLMVRSDEKPIMGPDKFNRITPKNIDGQINYLIQSAAVRGSELNDEDMKAVKSFIATGVEEGLVWKGMSVSAYASPDGEMDKNANLANDRANTAAKSVQGMLRSKKIDAAKSDDFFKKEGKGEDWAGFEKAVMASDFPDKDIVVRVLKMQSDLEVREKEIKNMAATYKFLAEEILPQQRRATFTLMAEKVGKSDEEISQLAKSDPSQLNVEEMLYAATLTDDMAAKLKIYQTAKTQFAKDWRGPNNAGYILMLQNKISDAQAEFEEAAKRADNGVINNNLGIISIKSGNRTKASEYYSKAVGAGPEVGYNMGIVDIKNGDYESAVKNMGSNKSFNAALAQMLKGDNTGATSTIEAGDDKASGAGYYLKAILGARTGNKEMMVNNLKSAIGKDAKFKAKAKTDVEFIKFMQDSDFIGLVN
ncbi:hypothetical protein N9C06_07075 [Salibacteraceae bacterium]|nr:hypothetical protein [Salibacteraceae bacterium]